jgi:hypothetical protein
MHSSPNGLRLQSTREVSMTTLINTKEAAELLGIRQQTLRVWRCRGTGPKYIRLSGPTGKALYDVKDINEWLKDRKYRSTSEEATTN